MSGTLTVRPTAAKLKRDTETFGKMDPFCRITLGGQEQKTRVHTNGGKFPSWSDSFTFQRSGEDLIIIEVLDKDTFNSDVIGETTLPIATIIEKKKSTEWYTISYKGKNAGDVLIEFIWQEDPNKNRPVVNTNTPSMMMMGGVAGQGQMTFNPQQAISFLPQMYMNQQVQQPGFNNNQFQGQNMMPQQQQMGYGLQSYGSQGFGQPSNVQQQQMGYGLQSYGSQGYGQPSNVQQQFGQPNMNQGYGQPYNNQPNYGQQNGQNFNQQGYPNQQFGQQNQGFNQGGNQGYNQNMNQSQNSGYYAPPAF